MDRHYLKRASMKNVLIVDDEMPVQLTISEGLGIYTKDLNVLTAENGKKAVEVMESFKVDLVVTDLNMSEMDGFELLAYIRKSYLNIPVIVMTGFSTTEIEKKLQTLDIFGYIEKPLNLKDLTDMILNGLAFRDTKSTKALW
jgi:DNA-binding NtrC family response regulator